FVEVTVAGRKQIADTQIDRALALAAGTPEAPSSCPAIGWSGATACPDASGKAPAWSNGMRLESLANLSHELRTPVQVLTGYLEILRENLSWGADSETHEIVERMNANMHELAQTIENLLEHVLAEADAAGPGAA